MARINTNISSIIAQANLNRTQNDLNVHLERLSTGLKINRGKDDPAGLIISERLRSNIEGVNQGISNAQRADSVISTAEGALAEVNDLLNSVRGLSVQSANTGANSAEERDANQLQIDSAIDSITRISNTASFGGLKLLDGSLDYTLSGLRNSAITTAKVRGASFAAGTTSIGVNVDVIASAQTGGLYYNGATAPPGQILSSMSLEIKGPSGVQVVTVASGTSLAALVSTINGFKAMTGVQASLINGNVNSGIVFNSVGYGSDAFVSVQRQGGPPQPADSFQTYRFANNAPVPSGSPFSWATYIGSGALESSGQDNGRDVSAPDQRQSGQRARPQHRHQHAIAGSGPHARPGPGHSALGGADQFLNHGRRGPVPAWAGRDRPATDEPGHPVGGLQPAGSDQDLRRRGVPQLPENRRDQQHRRQRHTQGLHPGQRHPGDGGG